MFHLTALSSLVEGSFRALDPTVETVNDLKVMTYNVNTDRRAEGNEEWRNYWFVNRAEHVFNQIAEIDPDLVLLHYPGR
jgi:hypothetical protein